MPELAVMGSLGFLICWIVNLVFLTRLRSDFRSPPYLCLQKNLSKIHLFWSEHRSELCPLADVNLIEQDQSSALRSFLVMATIASFASWLGLIFVLILVLSM